MPDDPRGTGCRPQLTASLRRPQRGRNFSVSSDLGDQGDQFSRSFISVTILMEIGPVEKPPTLNAWLLFAGLGAFGGIGHYFLTKAYEYGPAAVISPFNYLRLVGATIMGYIIFGDFPDHYTIVGASIIVACGLYIAHRESVRRRERAG